MSGEIEILKRIDSIRETNGTFDSSQNFRLFHVSNLSAVNFLLMYPGSVTRAALTRAALTRVTLTRAALVGLVGGWWEGTVRKLSMFR